MQEFWLELKKAVAGALITFLLAICLFWGRFSVLESNVNAQADTLKRMVPRTEMEQIYTIQKNNNDDVKVRLESLDHKIDKIYQLLIQLKI